MTIVDLLDELLAVERRFWFIERLSAIKQTDEALKARLEIRTNLFVQVFFNETTGCLQLALIEGQRRIYGRDNEGGQWHLHPLGSTDAHVPTPEITAFPVRRFLTEIEQIMIDHDLI